MRLITYLKNWRDQYVIQQVMRLKLPPFANAPIIRKRIVFSGRVQKVGFRLAIYELAKRLGLTGWVQNLADKSVVAEFQGRDDQITYVIRFLQSLKRASVKNVTITELAVVEDEQEFTVIK